MIKKRESDRGEIGKLGAISVVVWGSYLKGRNREKWGLAQWIVVQ